MQHPEQDDLALRALEHSADPAVDAHLTECAQCRSDVATYARTAELAPLSNYGEFADRPGGHVWDAIATELGFAGHSKPAIPAVTAPAAIPMPITGQRGPVTTARPAAPRPMGELVPVTPTRRRPRWAVPLAALVIGAALGAGTLALVQRDDSGQVEAIAALGPVPGSPIATATDLGTAELVSTSAGSAVRVDAVLPQIPGAYEVWLFGGDGRMVSLGVLHDGQGQFTVPGGIDPTEYDTVDISDEAPDGNPAHSGVSVGRGTFG